MPCIICKSTSKSWLLLNNDKLYTDVEGNNIGKTIQTCSYLCTRKCDNRLPRDYSHLVLNKEDFCYLKPVLSKKPVEFEIMTYGEILDMTDIEKDNYYTEKENHVTLDAKKQELYEEIEKEDMNTFNIENMALTSESEYDDY